MQFENKLNWMKGELMIVYLHATIHAERDFVLKQFTNFCLPTNQWLKSFLPMENF